MKHVEVLCPTCKKKFNYYSSEYRPFCSDRCKQVDIGHWLSESYAVPVEKLTEDELQTLDQLINEKENGQKDETSED